jgi:WD40 repeat protein
MPEAGWCVSSDCNVLAASRQSRVTLWDVSRAEPQARTTIDLPAPSRLGLVLGDGHHLSVDLGAESAAVGIWDIAARRQIARLQRSGTKLELSASAASPDGRFFATAYTDGRVVLWSTQTWTSIRELPGHSGKVAALSFSRDSRILATGSADTTVRLWSTATDAPPAVLEGDSGEVFSLAFSPDGETLAVGGADGLVKFWNVRTAREVAALKAHESVVSSLVFSPDGRTLASISVDQTMRLWRAPALTDTDR